MIVEVKMFTVQCDNCEKVYEGDDYAAWNDEGYAVECAENSGWYKDFESNGPNKHYCPKCFAFDDEDNLVINPNPEK